MLFLIVPTPSQEENRKHKRFWSDNKKGNGARSEAGQKRFPMARVLTKLATYAALWESFPWQFAGKTAALQKFARKKAAPDAQGRLQCCKWREF